MQWLAENELAVETTDESVSSAVGVNNLIGVDQMNGVFVCGAFVDNDGWQVTLCNDNSTLALVVDLSKDVMASQRPSWQAVGLLSRQTFGSSAIFCAISLISVLSHLLEVANARASVSLPNK